MQEIINLRSLFLSNFLKKIIPVAEVINWAGRNYSSPSPAFIKRAVILRNSIRNSIWVETGTYLGETAKFLSKTAKTVYTIEPQKKLYDRALRVFKSHENIQILLGLSEEVFPSLLPKISGDVNFWLDGHYSGGVTFLGSKISPILEELEAISFNLNHFSRVSILIDDIRCFDELVNQSYGYPKLRDLIDWMRINNFSWHIEHDIFCAKNY
ncbi:class I SAM-dependent methyltransferase [Polynucleobacter paneuropaeus]|nr:class I SAM-dependent methyltransferase [Polynucleobacter paneuropaeus]